MHWWSRAAVVERIVVVRGTVLARGKRIVLAGGSAGAALGSVLVPLVVLLLVLAPAPASGAMSTASSVGWVWPVDGPHEVSRPFAPPAFRYGVGHRGADLPAPPGSVVRAAGSGRVSYAGLLAGRGVVVVVHGDLRTTYEPVEATVSLGQRVDAGTPLGRLAPGHGGCPVAACLHWGLRRGDDYLDPVPLVERPPLRLLPVGPPLAAGSSRRSASVTREGAHLLLRHGADVGPDSAAPLRSGPASVPAPGPAPRPVTEPARAVRDDRGRGVSEAVPSGTPPGPSGAAPAAVAAAGVVVLAAAGESLRRRRRRGGP